MLLPVFSNIDVLGPANVHRGHGSCRSIESDGIDDHVELIVFAVLQANASLGNFFDRIILDIYQLHMRLVERLEVIVAQGRSFGKDGITGDQFFRRLFVLHRRSYLLTHKIARYIVSFLRDDQITERLENEPWGVSK
jgi:hypothetical protein